MSCRIQSRNAVANYNAMTAPPPALASSGDDDSEAFLFDFDADDAGVQSAVVPAAHAGWRLARSRPRLSPKDARSRLRSWLPDGRIGVDGGRAEASSRVRGGESMRFSALRDPAETAFVAEPMALPIVFED